MKQILPDFEEVTLLYNPAASLWGFLISKLFKLMLTAYSVLINYCKERELPEPSQNDHDSTGKMISHHFKNFWAPKQPLGENKMINGAGFTKESKNGKEYAVNCYPPEFENDMVERINVYYSNKGKEKVKKERKRIPVKPVYSKKPNGK